MVGGFVGQLLLITRQTDRQTERYAQHHNEWHSIFALHYIYAVGFLGLFDQYALSTVHVLNSPVY
jgi:hypothetical protein